jgi:hypothetical protein
LFATTAFADDRTTLPPLAYDRLVFIALWAAWREPKLLDNLGSWLSGEPTADKASALFRYLFIPTECPAVGTEDCGVGFRLRDPIERLQYANECGLAVGASEVSYEIREGHDLRS